MRQALSVLLGCFLVFAATSVLAAERGPLGGGSVALKVDRLQFTDDTNKDSGAYIGIEAYGKIAPNLYLGGEIGYANPEGTHADPFFEQVRKNSVTFVPLEGNLKYAIETGPNFAVDFGGGLSLNWVKEETTINFDYLPAESAVLPGAQVFADLNFAVSNFFFGLNGKFQVTENSENLYYSYTNWRIGGQIGILF
jgi:hypothetical protein